MQAADSRSGHGRRICDWCLGRPELKELVIGGKAVCTAFPRLKVVLSTGAGILAVDTELALENVPQKLSTLGLALIH